MLKLDLNPAVVAKQPVLTLGMSVSDEYRLNAYATTSLNLFKPWRDEGLWDNVPCCTRKQSYCSVLNRVTSTARRTELRASCVLRTSRHIFTVGHLRREVKKQHSNWCRECSILLLASPWPLWHSRLPTLGLSFPPCPVLLPAHVLTLPFLLHHFQVPRAARGTACA